MVSGTKRFKQHSQAVCTEHDGDVALFQSNTCDYLVLNETGSAIWNALKTQLTLPELCKHLEEEYEVTSDECKSAIETWLEAALEKKVIAVVED
ncbi:PqqD family protein [bacterium]|nr:PqqD family protein [bacterium]